MRDLIKGRVFVSGIGRSGSTVLVRAISQHPDIFAVPGPGSEMPYLVADPVRLFGKVFDYLGMPFCQQSADFVAGNVLHPTRRAGSDMNVQGKRDDIQSLQEDSSGFFNQRKSPHERWDAKQKTRFKAVCGPVMKRLGYEIPF